MGGKGNIPVTACNTDGDETTYMESDSRPLKGQSQSQDQDFERAEIEARQEPRTNTVHFQGHGFITLLYYYHNPY